ncbi:MAG TPA: hypothetical protein VGM64_03990 [Lacunisphaera sp.]|jgi:hypothetical protein
MTNDPSTTEGQPFSSLFHKAGSFAVGALVATPILQFIYMKAFFLQLSDGASALVGFVPMIVMLSAIPAGFIALCGIPKYGSKKLLWKGLLGLLIPFILFWLSVQVRALLVETVVHPERFQQGTQEPAKP